MKFKKKCFSTRLCDLYGRDNYQSHIEVGREYWYYFSREPEFNEGWYKIKITYIRSGCAFYVLSDLPEIQERFFPVSCFMAATLVFAEIDPSKDMDHFGTDWEKKMCRFDDERTVVKNWPNAREVELDENDELFSMFLIMCDKAED